MFYGKIGEVLNGRAEQWSQLGIDALETSNEGSTVIEVPNGIPECPGDVENQQPLSRAPSASLSCLHSIPSCSASARMSSQFPYHAIRRHLTSLTVHYFP